MQRISSIICLLVFMLILSWVGVSFQQEPAPLRLKEIQELSYQGTPRYMERAIPGRHMFPENSPEAPLAKTNPQVEDNPDMPWEETTILPVELHELKAEGAIHFLLLGLRKNSPLIEMVMIVSLIPEKHAHLTTLATDIMVEFAGQRHLLSDIFQRGGVHADLHKAIEDLTGLKMQFYIELDLKGFTEMVDMLGGVECRASEALSRDHGYLDPGMKNIDGSTALMFLNNPMISRAAKEYFLINLLITARDVDNTRLGISLLWKGYHSIKTNLTLSDLLNVRKVTQKISPTRVTFREIFPQSE